MKPGQITYPLASMIRPASTAEVAPVMTRISVAGDGNAGPIAGGSGAVDHRAVGK